MSLGFCIWLFVYFFHDLHVSVSLHTHICLVFGLCLCVFPRTWVYIYLYICICLWMLACVCTRPVYEWVDLPVPLCVSPFGFLYKDAITCICMSLEISNSNETSDISQMPGKPKVKSDAGKWLGRPSSQTPSGSTTIFFQDEVCRVFLQPFWLHEGPLLAASSNLDLHGPLPVHF